MALVEEEKAVIEEDAVESSLNQTSSLPREFSLKVFTQKQLTRRIKETLTILVSFSAYYLFTALFLAFARDSRNGTEKRELNESNERMEVDHETKPSGYEEEWRSDTEEDLQALQEITGGAGFISDYKRGDRLPIVLPAKDEAQYREVV